MMASDLIERSLDCVSAPLRHGAFVAVVGPSGAGKDSVLSYARERLAGESGVMFVRRVVTRPSDAAAEDHDTLGEAAFRAAESAGAFALSWEAHGLRYGLPAAIDTAIARGRVAVANVSRAILPRLCERYAMVAVVEIVATPEVLARRLAARGRESGAEVEARLSRSAPLQAPGAGVTTIDNSGPLDQAGERFVELLRRTLVRADISAAVE
jgi:ribose 1,5-bisphosphokinase